MSEHTAGSAAGSTVKTSSGCLYRLFWTPRAPLEVDGPADATVVVGECTGAGALRLPGSPALAVPVMYDVLPDGGSGGGSGMVVHFGIRM
jgi:hypothetical protein